jgi:hypothetical protein
VFGDRHEQQIKEVALRLGRLAAGQQQIEIGGKGKPAHQIGAKILAAHGHAGRVGRTDRRRRRSRLADQHGTSSQAKAPVFCRTILFTKDALSIVVLASYISAEEGK